LLRVVARDGVIVVDASATLPGRGAWVHPTPECVDASIKRRAFGRALRSNVALDTSQVTSYVLARQEEAFHPELPEEQAD
jgi:hypothetical protein